MNNLALLYKVQGKYARAEPLFSKVVELKQRVLDQEHPSTLISMNNLALLYEVQGKYGQAEPLFTKVLEVRRRVLGEEHPDTLTSMNSLALLYQNRGKYKQAEALLREALNGHQKIMTNTWNLYNCQSLLGASLAGQKKYGEAELLLLSGYEGMRRREATIPAFDRFKLEQAGEWVVQLYQDWGKPEQAAEWQERLQASKLPTAPVKP
jgi:tetratricopeptide (TPR) repeat protein